MPLFSARTLPNRRIISKPGLATSGHLLQASSLCHVGVTIDAPSFVLICRGEKRLGWTTGRLVAPAGTVIAIPGGAVVDINNDPLVETSYEAFWIMLDELPFGEPPSPETRPLRAPALLDAPTGFVAALYAAREAIAGGSDLPLPVARHRIAELMRWLEAAGYHLPRNAATTAAMAIRNIARRDLSYPWTAGEIARRLALSEPTMRRRLLAEGTSFTAVLTDLRLSQALALLQASDDPISQIALAVGYESQSSFASRFRQRFGHAPSAVRQATPSVTAVREAV